MTEYPPRGYLFTQRGKGWMSDLLRWGQALLGRRGSAVHAGIVGYQDDSGRLWIWESHLWSGVIYRPVSKKEVKTMRFWRPPCVDRLRPDDYARAFGALRAVRGFAYDILWILTLGAVNRRRRLICTELVRIYLGHLLMGVRDWPGKHIAKFIPVDVERICEEWRSAKVLEMGGCEHGARRA